MNPRVSPGLFQHCSREHRRQWRLSCSSAGRHLPCTLEALVCISSPTTQFNEQRNPGGWRLRNSKPLLGFLELAEKQSKGGHGRQVYTISLLTKRTNVELLACRKTLAFPGWLMSLPEQTILEGYTWLGKPDPGCPAFWQRNPETIVIFCFRKPLSLEDFQT